MNSAASGYVDIFDGRPSLTVEVDSSRATLVGSRFQC
ncbi:arginine N-succinyltransferase [Nocardia transvalensis]|nr:arginine N-succinyltransferase [Nocardia transvalensis]